MLAYCRWWTFTSSTIRTLECCPWNADACTRAATKRHLQVLQYSRTNGDPWNIGAVIRLLRSYERHNVDLWATQFINDEDDI